MGTQTGLKIESNDLSLGDIFKDFYSVPDFQREYVWEREHVEKLLEDVYNEFFDENGALTEAPEYFIGSIVVCRRDDGVYDLIDGQQRMTTAYLILCALRDRFEQLGEATPDPLKMQIAAASTDSEGETVFRYRVSLQYEDSEGVLEKVAMEDVETGEIQPTTASVRHILEAYQTIADFLEVTTDSEVKQLKRFMAAFTQRVKLIRIVTPDLTRALKVFETINDRGVGLTAMDLLKNLLFMRVSSTQYPKLKERWKYLVDTLDACKEKPLRFLRYYIMAHHDVDARRGIREDEIYDWFVKNGDSCGLNAAPLDFVETLVACARAYSSILEGNGPDGKPCRYLENILTLGGALRQYFILLLAGRGLNKQDFESLCRDLENLLFCYLLTRESGNRFERIFAQWARELRKVEDETGLQGFVEAHFLPEMKERSAAFDFRMQELTQSRIQQYRMRYILAKLTQYVDEQAWTAVQPLSKYINSQVDVEHILSQKPSPEVLDSFDKQDEYADYVEKLGNLALLEKTINTSVSNGAYPDKTPGYRQSSFLLTKSLVEQPQVGANTSLNRAVDGLQQFEEWDSQAIETRQAMLTKVARLVWSMPDKSAAEEVEV